MSQIEELQRRITAAMDRIGAGIEGLSAPVAAPEAAGSPAPDEDLAVALEDERIANAQLEERLKTLRARHEAELSQLREGAADSEETAALTAELESLRAAAADTSELDGLRGELDEARALLAEKSGAEEAAALAANAVEEMRAENEALVARLDAVEDAEPLKAEIAELSQQLETAQAIGAEVETLRGKADEVDALQAEVAKLRRTVEENEQAADLKSENDMLRAERVSQGAAMARLDDDLQRLRKSNAQLRELSGALREANAAGVGDAELINTALQAELDGLQATRASDAAEAQAVLARLEPLLAQAELVEGEDA